MGGGTGFSPIDVRRKAVRSGLAGSGVSWMASSGWKLVPSWPTCGRSVIWSTNSWIGDGDPPARHDCRCPKGAICDVRRPNPNATYCLVCWRFKRV